MASGAGALGNRSIGTAAAGGMFIGTFVGIFLVPGLYLIFESWSAHLNRNKVSYDEEDETMLDITPESENEEVQEDEKVVDKETGEILQQPLQPEN